MNNSYNIAYLTTFDNPFDPVSQWENWFGFDISHNYNTCSYLARLVKTSSNLPQKAEYEEIERAIDEIVASQPELYKKVVYRRIHTA